jgi:hypothetical protein
MLSMFRSWAIAPLIVGGVALIPALVVAVALLLTSVHGDAAADNHGELVRAAAVLK